MTVKLNIKAKNLDELGLELREKRKPRKKREFNKLQSISNPNIRTPYNLSSFGIRAIPLDTISQGNIPTINSAIALENLKTIENFNANRELKQIDNNDMKDFINKGLDDVYNRIGMGASNMGNTLLDEIKANREMINNFRTQKTFIPTGNNSPPASIDLNNNNFIPLSDQAHYQNYLDEEVDTDILPAYKPIKKETFTNDKSIRGKPISMANVIEELQLKFNNLKEREKDTEVFPNLKVEDAEDDEEEPQLKDEGDDEELPAIPEPINQPVLDFYNILFDNQGKAKNKIQGFNQAQLLNEFYKTYPDKNIKVKNGEIKIRNKKETDILNFNFPGVGKGIYSKLLKKIQNYVKDDL